jgi:uncharacterized membrane protein HdeD (DUF308 family)
MEQAQVAPPYESADGGGTSLWWIPLISGSLWVIFAIILFRFDYTTVSAISILVGCVCLAGAGFEAIAAFATDGWWRVVNIGLAIVFAIIGVVAFVHPQNTFEALATIFAFFLLIRGTFEVVVAILLRGIELWWIGLISGTIQILLAFWAAGDFGHKAFLLVVWVGASALAHGIVQIVAAFRLRPHHS